MNSGITSIKHLGADTKEKYRWPAHRIQSAFRLAHTRHNEHLAPEDLVEQQNAINAWATVTVCYSGIEQAMKFLRLIQGEELSVLKKREIGHSISTLFDLLEENERQVLRFSYRVYQSLHNYIRRETVGDFLNEIDCAGKGYGDWRYFLLQGGAPPITHPGAMLEVWSALCDIIKARIFSNHGLYSCDRRLYGSIKQCIHAAWMYGREETGVTSEETNVLNRWVESNDGLINAYAEFAHSHSCGTPSTNNETAGGPVVRPILLKSLFLLGKKAQKDQDLKYFLVRAKQRQGIAWNATAQQFMDLKAEL